jgi:hypothetical protein
MSSTSSADRSSPPDDEGSADTDDLVAFFRALRSDTRRAYDELAARDRRLGEDVTAEAPGVPEGS